jgi:hypothetical protein
MTTITRQQLRDAIEAGIASAAPTRSCADALREVGASATVVGRGSFAGLGTGSKPCPMALAFPGRWMLKAWSGTFAAAFDEATFYAAGQRSGVSVLHITDNERSTEGAA